MGMKGWPHKDRGQIPRDQARGSRSSRPSRQHNDEEQDLYRNLWPPATQSPSAKDKSSVTAKLANRFRLLNKSKINLSSRNGFGAEAENGNAKAQQISDDLQEFDEKLRSHRPDHDKAIIRRSFFISTLRVSWNLIEAEILHNPDSFDMGFDIQNYYTLQQSLTLEDLAKAGSKHTLKGLVKVINKVLKHLEDLREVEDYLKFVGRLHDVAGVDPRFLDVTGLAFCHALHHLDHKSLHGDIWNSQVKETWQTFFRVVVRSMKKGYAGYNASGDHRSFSKNQLVLFNEQKSLITEVWTTIQENILHYLSNSLVLPLVMRSNRSILKYFVTYETAVTNLNFDGSNGTATLEKTKHGCWFLTEVLGKVIPNLDALEACQDYLQELGAKHQAHGVRKEHLDLLALVYCASVRGVVATQGVKGGPLHETTKAWFNLLRFIVGEMKKGYSNDLSNLDATSERSDNETASQELLEPHQDSPPRLTTPDIPAQTSRNSSFSSTDDHGQFHVMRRRNAFINVDERSVNEDLSKLLGTSSGRSSRNFSLQF